MLGSRAVTSSDKPSHEFPAMSIELAFWSLAQQLPLTEEETEAWREEVTSSVSHSRLVKMSDASPDFLTPSAVLLSSVQ